ncbi:uncharacterized protein [Montipora capricornis]|uniref:uncharacterized protein n=1 Tax=Montipora capricornis TaxID=246305 RepID=UPI0035F1F2A0
MAAQIGRPWKCSACSKSYPDRSKLQRHEFASHRPEEHFSCSCCKRTFTRRLFDQPRPKSAMSSGLAAAQKRERQSRMVRQRQPALVIQTMLREKTLANNYRRFALQLLTLPLTTHQKSFHWARHDIEAAITKAVLSALTKDKLRLVKIRLSCRRHAFRQDQGVVLTTPWIDSKQTALARWNEILNHLKHILVRRAAEQWQSTTTKTLESLVQEVQAGEIEMECEFFF